MARKRAVSNAALKAFARKIAPTYLKQDNITAVGIGYKFVDKGGKPRRTDQISVQFSVRKKLAQLEQLEAIGAKELPKHFTIAGVAVPTDVIERDYTQSWRPVAVEAKLEDAASRKAVIDPIVPGVSIGHPDVSAGTAGCVVYDSITGQRLMLSNWHVLNGETGQVGDPVVQPGSWDDDRVDQNVVGALVRSHLGVAGDCAVASIEHRGLDPSILDLGVAVERIGEPELGDKVIKSGRTTDVTYGIVTRVYMTAKIDYGTEGVQQIGCFEIEPDPRRLPANGEISMGGDSGSCWMLADGRNATDVMLGLHFAGEVGDAPEHALACYASSVFEKLRILPSQPAEVFAGTESAQGFATGFLGTPLAIPTPATDEIWDDLVEVEGANVFDYVHFSLAMSMEHRLARWVAWNIDGGSIKRISRDGISFKKDPLLPDEYQIGEELYYNNPIDRGHIARRADLCWGTMEEAEAANIDSFFFTNISPQHRAFNQSGIDGIWGQLENAIFDEVDVEDLRLSVIGGPVFADDDPIYRDTRIPKQFWKIIYFRESGSDEIVGKGYVLTQADLLNELEALELPDFSVYEVPISRIAEMTGLNLPLGAAIETVRPRRRRGIEMLGEGDVRRVGSLREVLR